MSHDVSPAVKRASAAAMVRANRRNRDSVRLSDWLLGLLDDDEGKPAVLIVQLGAKLDAVRTALTKNESKWPVAPRDETLFQSAVELAVSLRGEPLLTTEFVLLAVLTADKNFRAVVAEHGISVPEVENRLRSDRVATEAAADAGPALAIPEPREQMDAARVVDANLNRARESLRVLDDYCRFVLDDAFLTETVKSLRHRLAAATAKLPGGTLLAARHTPGDVGTAVSAAGEYDRTSPAQVAAVNLKRLQESLRSVEEFGKVFGAEFGKAVEAIRYESYTLERAVVVGAAVRSRLADAKVYVLLTASQCQASLDWTIAEAAAGGADAIQLREKALTDAEFLERARNVRKWTRKAGVLFLVNDRPDIAKLAEADGVHLGQTDVPIAAARRILGPDALIGMSTHTVEQVRQAVRDGADYLGVGPTFPSKTKRFDHFPGLEFVRRATAETSLPAFPLGGITAANLPDVIAAGATRVAVSSFVSQAEDPRRAAAALKELLARAGK
jgi:thiamine-phosphate pyrophosphorylase